MAFLTILGQGREAQARAGHRGHERPASRRDLTRRSDPRVPACGLACVRMWFSRTLPIQAQSDWASRDHADSDTVAAGGCDVVHHGKEYRISGIEPCSAERV